MKYSLSAEKWYLYILPCRMKNVQDSPPIQLQQNHFLYMQGVVHKEIENMIFFVQLEKPLNFDPFGQIEFAPVGHNIIAPCKVLVQGSILFYPFRYSGFS